ncbi:hypothetical protein E143388_07769 [Rhodococcus opacus]|nr:hypothetical protein E143388_07769 [Rhodococcus opacus]
MPVPGAHMTSADADFGHFGHRVTSAAPVDRRLRLSPETPSLPAISRLLHSPPTSLRRKTLPAPARILNENVTVTKLGSRSSGRLDQPLEVQHHKHPVDTINRS